VSCKPFRLPFPNRDIELLRELEEFSPDIIFVPVERCFSYKNIPVVNMLQNMEPLAYSNEGNSLQEKLRNWMRARTAQMAMKKADKIIAVSRFVKEVLIKKLNICESKIELISYGMDGPGDCNKPSNIPIDWQGKFVFTAGSIRPARGLEDLLQATYYLHINDQAPILVIAGDTVSNMVGYQKRLKRWVEEHNLSDRVFWVGNLDEAKMLWCYQNCNVFVMSSRVESFGQTALEAMSQGCVCISADNPCLPEIFKEAAVYYPSKDSQSLAKVIKYVLNWDSSQREEMVELAKKRASDFSWDICAKKIVEELKKACKH
jgi:glycosyltransferase involved in cell wall biosynthesis